MLSLFGRFKFKLPNSGKRIWVTSGISRKRFFAEESPVEIKIPSRKPVDFHLAKRVARLPEEKQQAVKSLEKIIEGELFEWVSFPLTLPDSKLKDLSKDIQLQSHFNAPVVNELDQVARNPNGQLKRLTETQLREISETGKFTVSSENFENQKHVWKVTRFLQTGKQNVSHVYRNLLSHALSHILVKIPSRLLQPQKTSQFGSKQNAWLSIPSAIKYISEGSKDIPEILFGLSSKFAKLNAPKISRKVEQERQKFIKSLLTKKEQDQEQKDKNNPKQEIWCTPQGVEVDFSFYALLHQDDVQKRLRSIEKEVEKEWAKDRQRFQLETAESLRKKLRENALKNQQLQTNTSSNNSNDSGDKSSGEKTENLDTPDTDLDSEIERDVAQHVADECVAKLNLRLLSGIRRDEVLNAIDPRLGGMIADYLTSILIFREVAEEHRTNLLQKRSHLSNSLKQKYPLRSQINEWLEKQINSQLAEKSAPSNVAHGYSMEAIETVLTRLEARGLKKQAFLLRKTMEFEKLAEQVSKEAESEKRPTRVFNFPINYWRKDLRLLTIEKIPKKSGEKAEHYIIKSTFNRTTHTGIFGWRWWNIAERSWMWMNNGCYFLLVSNLWNGIFSIRALLSPSPMYPYFCVRPSSSDVKDPTKKFIITVDDSKKVESFMSRLTSIWKGVFESRREFEERLDTSFIGRTLVRPFHVLWNYIGKGLCGTVAVFLVFPIVTCINVILSLSLVITSPLWAPMIGLFHYLSNAVLYDFDAATPEKGTHIFPVLRPIIKILLLGIGQYIGAVAAAVFYHPIMALTVTLYATLIFRPFVAIYDFILFHTVIKKRARIPPNNSRLVWRVSGPGVGKNFVFQVKPSLVLITLQAQLEREQLEVYKEYIRRKVYEPERIYWRMHLELFTHFGMTLDYNNPVVGRIVETRENILENLELLIQNREESHPIYAPVNTTKVRLEVKELNDTLYRGTLLLKYFYEQFIFCYMNQKQQDTYWRQKQLAKDDFRGLTKLFLADIFSQAFLTPLDMSDNNKTYRLTVNEAELGKFVSELFSTVPETELAQVDKIVGALPSKVPAKYPAITVENLFFPLRAVKNTITLSK